MSRSLACNVLSPSELERELLIRVRLNRTGLQVSGSERTGSLAMGGAAAVVMRRGGSGGA